jgi:hypothetical protein
MKKIYSNEQYTAMIFDERRPNNTAGSMDHILRQASPKAN